MRKCKNCVRYPECAPFTEPNESFPEMDGCPCFKFPFEEINIEALKKIVKERGLCFEGLALDVGVDRSTLHRKLKRGLSAITVVEYFLIKQSLKLTPEEEENIFNVTMRGSGCE